MVRSLRNRLRNRWYKQLLYPGLSCPEHRAAIGAILMYHSPGAGRLNPAPLSVGFAPLRMANEVIPPGTGERIACRFSAADDLQGAFFPQASFCVLFGPRTQSRPRDPVIIRHRYSRIVDAAAPNDYQAQRQLRTCEKRLIFDEGVWDLRKAFSRHARRLRSSIHDILLQKKVVLDREGNTVISPVLRSLP